MEKKFTQGVWQVADCISNSERYLAVWKDKDKVICLVSPKSKETEDDLANAKLMAAAPELLESLEDLVSYSKSLIYWLEHYGAVNMTTGKQAIARLENQVEKSNQAIKKALE